MNTSDKSFFFFNTTHVALIYYIYSLIILRPLILSCTCCGSEKSRWDMRCGLQSLVYLSTLSTDAAGELNVFRHYGDALGVDGTQIRVLEESNQVRFARFLEGHHS